MNVERLEAGKCTICTGYRAGNVERGRRDLGRRAASPLWQIINIRWARGHYVCYYSGPARARRAAVCSVALTLLSEMDSGVDLIGGARAGAACGRRTRCGCAVYFFIKWAARGAAGRAAAPPGRAMGSLIELI